MELQAGGAGLRYLHWSHAGHAVHGAGHAGGNLLWTRQAVDPRRMSSQEKAGVE
jgi:hypothetical protein